MLYYDEISILKQENNFWVSDITIIKERLR